MGAFSIIDRILGIARIVGRASDEHIGENLREWGRFANTEPLAAAASLERVAIELDAARAGFHPRRRWVRRRLQARANAYRTHAWDLRRRAGNEPCPRNPLRRPGT